MFVLSSLLIPECVVCVSTNTYCIITSILQVLCWSSCLVSFTFLFDYFSVSSSVTRYISCAIVTGVTMTRFRSKPN